MIKTLRPYQQQALDKLRERLRDSTRPLLINASVGSGKSLIIAELLFLIEKSGWRALCLTLNSTLVQQNAEAYRSQGGNPGIYCAGLDSKDTANKIIFASPHSIVNGIKNQEEISRQPFNLIVVDEAHNINPHNPYTMFLRILNHYGLMAQTERYNYRVVGLTGTPYRGKSISIVGETQYFKEEVCSIGTSWLIEQGYLTKPQFGLPASDSYNFSQLKVNSMGRFDQKQLQAEVDSKERLTGEIMRELVTIVENGRNGAFIFASTRKHCLECANALPKGQWAIITGETPHEERKSILAQAGLNIKYLISVNCLTVGVDIPCFDVCAILRPTESLVLYTQAIGRVLRLHPGKSSALILDFAGNIERHGDVDDPIINEAIKPTPDTEKDFCIPCYDCNTLNTVHSRRCVGIVNQRRCDHYFEFKGCPICQTQNDIVARQCRSCEAELIDPNAKLKRSTDTFVFTIDRAEFWITSTAKKEPILNAKYISGNDTVFECHYMNSDKARNIAYARFIRPHIPNASDYYLKLHSIVAMKGMLESGIKMPNTLVCTKNDYGRYAIIKKLFDVAN